jgi:hypothetical protein
MSQYFDEKDTSSFLSPKVTQYGSHMVMTNVSRNKKTKYWNIDTQFRDDYQNISQYTFTLPQVIPNVNSISVSDAEIPISFSNISASLGNNVMKITRNSNSAVSTVVISDGWYSIDSLKSKINDQLHNVFDLSGLTYDVSLNNYSTFYCTNDSFTIEFAVGATAQFDKYSVKSKLGWQLGFRDISYRLTANTSTALFVSSSPIDILRPRYLYLVVDEYSGNTPNSFISPLTTSVLNKNILAKIIMDYTNYTYGTVIPANEYNGYLKSDTRTYGGNVNLQKLNIQLVNEYGTAVNLNGQDFSFCLKIEYE